MPSLSLLPTLPLLLSLLLLSSPLPSLSRALPSSSILSSPPSLLSSAFSPCAVESWAFCVSDCPSPLEDVRIGQKLPLSPPPGAHLGSFLARAASRGERESMGACCRFCTEFNRDHFGDIFGYTCDYWSWEAETGQCSLYDKAMVCRSPAHLITEVFNSTREDVISFPAAC